MRDEPETLEAEVVEIDGVAPVPSPSGPQKNPRGWQDWRTWQGRVRTLDARWWPLWLILGILAITLILTIGLIIGIGIITFRILTGILRGFFSLFSAGQRSQIR